jgi:hypothetical protein
MPPLRSVPLRRVEAFGTALGLRLIAGNERYLRFECPNGNATFSVELVERPPAGAGVTICSEPMT